MSLIQLNVDIQTDDANGTQENMKVEYDAGVAPLSAEVAVGRTYSGQEKKNQM